MFPDGESVPDTGSTIAHQGKPEANSPPGSGDFLPPFSSWLTACCLGWVLGVPMIALLAALSDLLGVGGSQALVGLGMGAAVGWVQGGRLRRLGVSRAAWFWSSALGVGAPFNGWDLARHFSLPGEYSLPRLLLVGGTITGVAQERLLGPRLQAIGSDGRRAGCAVPRWWPIACVAGWGTAGWYAGLGDVLIKTHAARGLAGAALYRASVAIGGPLLGLVTGAVFPWRLRVQV